MFLLPNISCCWKKQEQEPTFESRGGLKSQHVVLSTHGELPHQHIGALHRWPSFLCRGAKSADN